LRAHSLASRRAGCWGSSRSRPVQSIRGDRDRPVGSGGAQPAEPTVSSLDPDPGAGTATLAPDVLAGRPVALGRYTSVRRYLPDRARRTIGAWCFLDHFGPDEVAAGPGMRVP